MDGHVAKEEWKDQNPSREALMPSVLTGAFPPDTTGRDGNEGANFGFEKHGFAANSPQEGGRSLPMTPQFGQKTGSSSSFAERVHARTGFRVPKLNVPVSTATGADNAVPGASSPYLTIPPGLSPATLLESPVFISNAMGQASPTTGKLFMLGGTNDLNPNRYEGPPQNHGAFSFKPLDLKSSHYIAEAKESSRNNQHPSPRSTQVPIKSEANVQTVEATTTNLPDELNLQHLNVGQPIQKSGSKQSRPAPDPVTGTEHLSPPDHSQQTEESDARGDLTSVATASPAEDGYSWRKYGQKQVKHSEYPRSYYKCTHPNCQVKKKVERSHEGHVTEIVYKGMHNHPKPAQSRRPGVPAIHSFGDAQVNVSDSPGSQAKNPWQNNAGVQDSRGDGVDPTSSPSVPGELCDSSPSMQVRDGARFGSPGGVDVTSAVSDEVDGDRVTHGSLSQGGAGAEGDKLESKRRKLESYAIDMGCASRAVREPRVVIQTTSEVDILDDGYRWRKYGQKVVKGNPNPRSYYKCTHPGCSVRKHVERASHDLQSVITTYEGKHNHEVPAARNSGHPSSAAPGAAMAAAGHHRAGARLPDHHHSSVQDTGLMRLGGCAFGGLPPRDPLVPMANYPYATFGASLPSLPMLPGLLGPVEGLKVPMLATSMHRPLLRHRQAMEAAGLVAPKVVEVKREAGAAGSPGGDGSGNDNADAAATVYQQLVQRRRMQLGHKM